MAADDRLGPEPSGVVVNRSVSSSLSLGGVRVHTHTGGGGGVESVCVCVERGRVFVCVWEQLRHEPPPLPVAPTGRAALDCP